jgi:hypothetical protein
MFPRRWLWIMPSSWMLHPVAVVRTDISEGGSSFIIRVTRIGELATMLAVTSNWHTLRRNAMWEWERYYEYQIDEQRGVGVAGNGVVLVKEQTTKWDSIDSVEGVGVGCILKNAVLWDAKLCGPCENRRFRRTYLFHYQVDKNRLRGSKLCF